ncbi:MAG: hypothetical protein JXB38_01065 [Anaerolineales bacterium]|nr:hypothetical protein [Anaerolineales bacterium]
MQTLQIEARVIGRKKAAVPGWGIPVPDAWFDDQQSKTLKDLITYIVASEVDQYNLRQKEDRFLRFLSNKQIEDQLVLGKIEFGDKEPRLADSEPAINEALLAFTDGLYYVFIDEAQQTDLNQIVHVCDSSVVTFVRLVALAGG